MVDYVDRAWVERARTAVTNGKTPFLKSDFSTAIDARVEKIWHRGETKEAARSRFMRTDPDADSLWDAMMLASDR
jgi:hypothetical protein